MGLTADETKKLELIERYRPILAKKLGLNEDDVLPRSCEKHDVKLTKGEYGWYCEKCVELFSQRCTEFTIMNEIGE